MSLPPNLLHDLGWGAGAFLLVAAYYPPKTTMGWLRLAVSSAVGGAVAAQLASMWQVGRMQRNLFIAGVVFFSDGLVELAFRARHRVRENPMSVLKAAWKARAGRFDEIDDDFLKPKDDDRKEP